MSPPLTIGYITGEYGRASDTFIREEVAALRDLGHTVHTFSIREPAGPVPDDAVAAERAGTDYVLARGLPRLTRSAGRRLATQPGRMAAAAGLAARVGSPGVRGRSWPAAYLLEAAYVAERLDELRIHHLHDHISEGSAAVAMMASAMAGVPFSMTVHGPGEFDRAPQLALGLKVGRAAFVAAISEYARAQLLRWTAPADWHKVEVVRCGVPARLLEREPTPTPDDRRLVNVGRLEEAKGQVVLVDAVAELLEAGEEPFEVLIAGEGPLRAMLEAHIRERGVEHAVKLLGAMGHREVAELIAGSRGLVQPSFAEGIPVTVMEALALGRAVIATPVGGVTELVDHGGNGWLVAPGSRTALAGAMREALAAAPPELDRMGRAGAARVAERHDVRTTAARLAELFAASAGARER